MQFAAVRSFKSRRGRQRRDGRGDCVWDRQARGAAIIAGSLRETLPFLALPPPFCQRMMPLLVGLQHRWLALPEDRLRLTGQRCGSAGRGAVSACQPFFSHLPASLLSCSPLFSLSSPFSIYLEGEYIPIVNLLAHTLHCPIGTAEGVGRGLQHVLRAAAMVQAGAGGRGGRGGAVQLGVRGLPFLGLSLPSIVLPLTFHCLSSTVHCLSLAFPLPFLDLPLPFRCM